MSDVTTDFDAWYEANEPEDQQDKDDLMQSVETPATVGNYTTEEKDGQFFVYRGAGGGQLRLASEKARTHFLRYVRDGKVPDDEDLAFQRAMQGPKS